MVEFAPIHAHASIVFSLVPRNSSQKGTEQRLAPPATSNGMRSAGVPATDANIAVSLPGKSLHRAFFSLTPYCLESVNSIFMTQQENSGLFVCACQFQLANPPPPPLSLLREE